MDKSIEEIWHNGFSKEESDLLPKVANLFARKSKGIVSRMNRLVRFNIILLYAMAVIVFIMSIVLELPIWLALLLVTLFVAPAIYTKVQLQNNFPDVYHDNCFEYLSTIRVWLKNQLAQNVRLARFYYPLSVIAAAAITWFSKGREEVLEEILLKYPDIPMVLGFPVYFIIPVLVLALLMGVFAGRVYKFDVGLIYGRVLRKLDETLKDLEELR